MDYYNQTTIHPLGLAMTVACGAALLLLPRRFAVWPFIIMACFVAPAQRIVIATLDFNLLRILVVFGFIRVLTRGEFRGITWVAVDYIIVVFAFVRLAAYTALRGDVGAFIYQTGQVFDSIGMYFLFRALVREWADIIRIALCLVIVSVPVLFAFVIENRTGRNAFAFFGGVPAVTMVREGRLRCTGAFAHPILAGCFWAVSLPIIAAMCWLPARRWWAVAGAFTCVGVVGFTASSTPAMGLIAGAMGAAFFFIRWWMRWVTLGAAVMVVLLHMVMNAPVWHLISRITISRGSTGYHRFLLIDNFIRRFDEWAIAGTLGTDHWFHGGNDVTNQYILEGVTGGALALLLFLVMIGFSFYYVGCMWRIWSKDRARLIFSWALGVVLWVHCVNFIGVSYFGQIIMLWYLHLAMISSMYERARTEQRLARRAVAIAAARPAAAAPTAALREQRWSSPSSS